MQNYSAQTIEEIKAEIEAIKARMEELEARIAELEAAPAEDIPETEDLPEDIPAGADMPEEMADFSSEPIDISVDLEEFADFSSAASVQPADSMPEPVQTEFEVPAEIPAEEPAEEPEQEPAVQEVSSEAVEEEAETAEPLVEDLPEDDVPAAEEQAETAEPEPAAAETAEPEPAVTEPAVTEPETVPEPAAEPEPEPAPEPEQKEKPAETPFLSIFGEPEAIVKPYVNINDAEKSKAKKAVMDVAREKLAWRTDRPGTPVKNIISAVSLADRALLINTLFKGDPIAFNDTITALNGMGSFAEAEEFITKEHPEWNLGSDIAYRLMMAIRRKLK